MLLGRSSSTSCLIVMMRALLNSECCLALNHAGTALRRGGCKPTFAMAFKGTHGDAARNVFGQEALDGAGVGDEATAGFRHYHSRRRSPGP
ncbi:MAG TPA: hypothetical protein VFQ88_00505 [Nevskiaceae bacterium]|nr:hypothetical protein [Nevskiaceae bacterium]